MELRKQQEMEHYDTGSQGWLAKPQSFAAYKPLALGSYQWCYALLKKYATNKRILDYGCGSGVHLPYLAQIAKQVVGIDISKSSLAIAQKRIETLPQRENIILEAMDCENLAFMDNSFDVVFDGGTFSSLDYERSLKEISRVLTPDGFLIGIETFGHNPITNWKRSLNKGMGKRTSWAASHILTNAHLELAKKYFQEMHVYYFHLTSLVCFPLLGMPVGVFLLRFLEKVDTILFIIPFLRKYAFKIVFVFSKPIKKSYETPL